MIHDYYVSNQPGGGGGVGSRVGSGRVRHCVGRVGSDNWLLKSGRVESGPDPGGSGRVRKIGPGNNSGRTFSYIAGPSYLEQDVLHLQLSIINKTPCNYYKNEIKN